MPTLRNCSIMLMVSSLFCQFCFTLLAFSRRVRIRLTTASYSASRLPAVKPSMPNVASSKPFCIRWVGAGGVDVFAVQVPAQRVGRDVFANAVQGAVAADDVFVIIALPHGGTRRAPTP